MTDKKFVVIVGDFDSKREAEHYASCLHESKILTSHVEEK